MHESIHSIEVCNVAYPINDEQHTLVNRCGKTFCSKCAQVEDIVAKDVYEEDFGVVFAPGFEFFGTEGKESQIVIGMAPPMGVIDDADLPSLPVPDFEPVTLPQNIDPIVDSMPAPALPKMDVVGMEAPVFQDTANEATLEAPMNENTSMVPPGLEKKARMSRYSRSRATEEPLLMALYNVDCLEVGFSGFPTFCFYLVLSLVLVLVLVS
eukprot:TRINITY_DN1133_c0_g1_i1.p1 TRINITY_DN1133_c0_g1~~TRINITY_DN1133_c0_g1_i1.p1  ORF type:complete len:230 (-),score=35.58 TRINITY_DN1133_c0_g1_i1:78-707(-)